MNEYWDEYVKDEERELDMLCLFVQGEVPSDLMGITHSEWEDWGGREHFAFIKKKTRELEMLYG